LIESLFDVSGRKRDKMTRIQRTALVCLLLSCGVSVMLGFFPVRNRPDVMLDFRAVYYGTRCLLEHHDPYNPSELENVYRTIDGEHPSETVTVHQAVVMCINLPTTLLVVTPFAMLQWTSAHLLWMILTAVSLVFAGFLMWNFSANDATIISAALICFILANSEVLLATGNTAGIAVSLCVVAVWCFLQERYVWAGVLCLAVSLAIKPHDAGFIWLYFLLAGGVYRKRALQVLVVTAVLGLAAIVWVTPIAPHWMQELHSNIQVGSSPGGINEPGPTSLSGRSASVIIDLQAVISIFQNDPRIYNSVSYMVCGALLLVWSVCTLRARFSLARAWLALAAVVPLTLLVTYHRTHDAKLLLLTIPACGLLWAEGRTIRWVALVVSTAAIVFTADFPLIIILALTRNLHISNQWVSGHMPAAVLMSPVPLILLAMSIFYLWIYVQRASAADAAARSGENEETPLAPTKA
jgi:hypothetical protein